MEQKGYFEPGFASVDFTSACNLFFGGTGAIFYTGSGQISLAEEMYDNGELGFFRYRIQKEWTICLQMYRFMLDLQKDSIRLHMMIQCRNSLTTCARTSQTLATLRAHVFSPFKEDSLPEGLPQLYYDTQPMFENAETAWTSWDDKLDSDVLTKIVDEQQKLARGELPTPDEFIETCDSFC